MPEFYISLPAEEIAKQVAQLINKYNRLYKRHNVYSIMNSPVRYFIEVYGDKVVGCTALQKEEPRLSRNFHTCVDPSFRRQGIAKKLKLMALNSCETEFIFSTVREDNIPSVKMNQSLGYLFVRKEWSKDHHVITFGRATNVWRGGCVGVRGAQAA